MTDLKFPPLSKSSYLDSLNPCGLRFRSLLGVRSLVGAMMVQKMRVCPRPDGLQIYAWSPSVRGRRLANFKKQRQSGGKPVRLFRLEIYSRLGEMREVNGESFE